MAIQDRFDIRETPPFRAWEYERWLLDYDATDDEHFPEHDSGVGYLYLLGLSDGWIKVGQTTRWRNGRRTTLRRHMRRQHGFTVEREWKTPALPEEELDRHESVVVAYARRLEDESRLTYARGGRRSEETEMFHGVDFGRLRAYADVVGRCAAVW